MLAKNEIRNLHKKAAKYFKKQRNVDRVLVHLVALSAWSPVVKLLLSGNSKWSKIEDYERLLFWIDQLPEAVITKHPVLSILLGKAYLYLGRLDIAWKNLKRAQDYTRVGSKNWLESGCRLCEILLLKGYLEEGTELAEQVVDRAGFVSRHKAEGLMFQAIGLHLLCRFDECERLWRHISTLASSRFLPLDQAARCYLMAPKAVFYNLERGEFKESERILDLAITVFRSKDPRKRLGWVLLFKGVVKLELQQKKEAVMWFREAVEVSGKTNRSVHAGCTAFLSYVLADLGETDEAKEWLDRAAPIVSNDLTLWAPVLCALARTMMAGDPNTALNELHLAWNLAKQRKMLLPISFIAYTAFLVRNQIGRLEAERFCRKAAGISEQNRVQHREAQHLLNLHQMDREQGGALDSPELSKAMTIISQKRLGFVLVNTRQADCLELVIQAVQEDIDTDYFLSLCKHWGKRACAALISIFDCASPVVKEKIATVWTENGYRPALPHIQHILKVSRHKKTKTVFKAMLCKLERSPLEPLHIALLGSFNLIKGETHLLEGSWKRKKSKELFKLLCLNPSTTFTQDYLMELFWPESSPDKAKANLWSVVSSLKLTLEPELSSRAKSNYLLYNGYSYQLRLPVGSTVDALLFEENARQGIHYRKTGDNARALICLAMADELYKGELLPDNLYEVWSEEAREHLKSMFTRVLRVMAEIYFEQREFGKCIELYQRIIKIDLWDEKSYLALMQCYVLQGNDLMAIRIFKNCEKVLGKELNVTPNEHLQAMLQRILRRRLVSCQPSNVG
jgi:DNA-binding SARP family transcriptional activator